MAAVLLNIPSKKQDVIHGLIAIGYIVLRSTLTTTTLHHLVVPKMNNEPKPGDIITIENDKYKCCSQADFLKDCERCDMWQDHLGMCDKLYCSAKERNDKLNVYFKKVK